MKGGKRGIDGVRRVREGAREGGGNMTEKKNISLKALNSEKLISL